MEKNTWGVFIYGIWRGLGLYYDVEEVSIPILNKIRMARCR